VLSGTVAPVTLSDWSDSPRAATASGNADPIRVFETAEAALRFIASLDHRRELPGRRLPAQQPAGRAA
jgi:hypothetical protein